MDIFLFASCRVHRPFNCDRTHETGLFNNYNCLDTKWFEPNFIGSVYCSNYILMLIKILVSRNISEKDKFCYPHVLTDEHFYELCDTFLKAQVIIVEISTVKYKKLGDRYISNEEAERYSKYADGIIREDELSKNITELQDIIQKAGKQVLFVSHFIINSKVFDRKLLGRKQIIDSLTKHATYFYNPTSLVQSDVCNNLVDSNHYSHAAEVLVMNELHNHLQMIQDKHFNADLCPK
jgi:hypothetical protein